jgi:hypothetical protein
VTAKGLQGARLANWLRAGPLQSQHPQQTLSNCEVLLTIFLILPGRGPAKNPSCQRRFQDLCKLPGAPRHSAQLALRGVKQRNDDTDKLHTRPMRHLMHLPHTPLPGGRCGALLVPLIVLFCLLSVSASGGVTHSCTLWLDGTQQQVCGYRRYLARQRPAC